MMTDLDYLRLLERTLESSIINTTKSMGTLANDIESIRSSLEDASQDFTDNFARLWAALEVVAVEHQERGTEPTEKEIEDLEDMKNTLIGFVKREIAERSR